MSQSSERSIFQKIFDSMMEVTDGDLHEARPELGAESQPPEFPGYTLVRSLGSGGFATVYLAHDEDLDRDVALKVLAPERRVEKHARERFVNEARALARVRHNHVLSIYGVEEKDGVMALAVEYVRGQDLDGILREKGRLSAAEATRIGIEMCQALAAVHAEGIIHRDVKTSNILREEGGRHVLADFGLGAFVERESGNEKLDRIVGSPFFMSPEQVSGQPLDARSDLYSVGVVLYHLTSGQFPCAADDVKGLFAKISHGDFVPLRDVRPDIPAGFAAVVSRALSTSPEERFQSAGEMEEALTETLRPTAGKSNSAGMRRRVALSCAVLFLLVTGWIWLQIFPGGSPPAPFRPPRVNFHCDNLKTVRTLTDRDEVRAGDHVFLEFESDEDLYVYVLNEDDRGERFLLFPFLGATTRNPLAGGQSHRIPGVNQDWEASSGGGEDWVCVLASRQPLKELEKILSLGTAGGAAEGSGIQYLQMDGTSAARLASSLRSLGGLVAAREAPTGAPGKDVDLRDLVVQLITAPEEDRPVWVESVRFRNK